MITRYQFNTILWMIILLLSSFSTPSWSQTFSELKFEPYPVGQEIDLWRLEAIKQVRSPVILSPDKSRYAYTEVTFMPDNRQTFSKLYWVPVINNTAAPEGLPGENIQPVLTPEMKIAPYDPSRTLKMRQEILGVGHDKPQAFEFRTLTAIDWSASGNRLLFKQRVGSLHAGLKTSDILLFDQHQGTITIYPELKRIVRYHWLHYSNLPDLDTVAWDIFPLGWQPGSDSEVLFKAWAYDKKNRKFLGIWSYDIDHERSKLITKEDIKITAAQNGWAVDLVKLKQQVTPPDKKPWWKRNPKDWF